MKILRTTHINSHLSSLKIILSAENNYSIMRNDSLQIENDGSVIGEFRSKKKIGLHFRK